MDKQKEAFANLLKIAGLLLIVIVIVLLVTGQFGRIKITAGGIEVEAKDKLTSPSDASVGVSAQAGITKPAIPAGPTSTVVPTHQPPLTPTAIPQPTATPIPVPPTPLSDTTPGTILDVGQKWRQRGVELKLTKFNFQEYDNEKWVWVWFDLVNLDQSDKAIRYSIDNFSATDNQGRNIKTGAVGNYIFTQQCDTNTVVLSRDKIITLHAGDCQVNYPHWSVDHSVALSVDYGNPSLTELIVKASGISTISNAQWKIPLNH